MKWTTGSLEEQQPQMVFQVEATDIFLPLCLIWHFFSTEWLFTAPAFDPNWRSGGMHSYSSCTSSPTPSDDTSTRAVTRFAVFPSLVSRAWRRFQETWSDFQKSWTGSSKFNEPLAGPVFAPSCTEEQDGTTRALQNDLQQASVVTASDQTIKNRLHEVDMRAWCSAVGSSSGTKELFGQLP